MSYILDALRRADSERERGAVPGVHAQVQMPGASDADTPRPSRLWPIASVVLALVLAAVVGWQFFGRAAPPAAEPVPVPKPISEPAEVPAPAPAVVAAPPTPRPPAPVARVASPPVAVAPKPVAPRAAPAPPPLPASAVAAVAAPPPPARIPMASELPDDVRNSLPALTIGGASYSQNAENRMLIVNGQVFREGDKLSADVTLEQIRLKEAVLSAKGVRYRIAY